MNTKQNRIKTDMLNTYRNNSSPNDIKEYLNMPTTVVRNGQSISIQEHNAAILARLEGR